MQNNAKISAYQFAMVAMGLLFGGTAVLNPAAAAKQDAWIVDIISFAAGFVLISIYVKIAALYPGKTLVDILRDAFGKIAGSIIAGLYLWYIIHVLALALRSSTDFMTNTIYPETPGLFISVVIILVSVYMVKKGIEVIARVSELLIPVFLVSAMTLFFSLISLYEPNNFLPVLENGLSPLIGPAFQMTTFPYGEAVVLLVIFPVINDNKSIYKSSYIALLFVGFILLMISARELMTLGPDMMERATNANFVSSKLVPGVDIEALIAINLMIGSGIKVSVCLYAAIKLIAQLFNIAAEKLFTLPVAAICVGLSMWLFDSIMEKAAWQKNVYPYYALLYQVLIPVSIMIVSLIKNRNTPPIVQPDAVGY